MKLRIALLCAVCAVFAVVAVSYGGEAPEAGNPVVTPAAQEAPTLSRVWFFKVKPGRELDFETGAKAHLAWLADNGAGWAWTGFTIETGPRVGEYGFVSAGHAFGDFDAYDAHRDAILASFRETVGDTIESMESIITVAMPAVSNPPDEPFAFAQITRFDVAFDKMQQFEAAVAKYHEALGDDWAQHYSWSAPFSGTEGPSYTVVTYFDSWADMMPRADMDAHIDEVYGRRDAQILREQFSDTVIGMESWMARIRPDLSLNPGM